MVDVQQVGIMRRREGADPVYAILHCFEIVAAVVAFVEDEDEIGDSGETVVYLIDEFIDKVRKRGGIMTVSPVDTVKKGDAPLLVGAECEAHLAEMMPTVLAVTSSRERRRSRRLDVSEEVGCVVEHGFGLYIETLDKDLPKLVFHIAQDGIVQPREQFPGRLFVLFSAPPKFLPADDIVNSIPEGFSVKLLWRKTYQVRQHSLCRPIAHLLLAGGLSGSVDDGKHKIVPTLDAEPFPGDMLPEYFDQTGIQSSLMQRRNETEIAMRRPKRFAGPENPLPDMFC